MLGTNIEVVFIQQQRLGRLRANTSFLHTGFYSTLIEFAPTTRVLSGELIVFQNEMLEIFKRLMDYSECPLTLGEDHGGPLKARGIIAVMLEFLRTLIENQIP